MWAPLTRGSHKSFKNQFQKSQNKDRALGSFALSAGSTDTWRPAISLFFIIFYFKKKKEKKKEILKDPIWGFTDNNGLSLFKVSMISCQIKL